MLIIGIIFDYDDTIMPDTTTQLLKSYGVDTKTFWNVDFKKLINEGWNPANAYLKLLLDNIGKDKKLGELTNKELREFGKSIERTQYPGLDELFKKIRNIVKEYRDIKVEFYIISGGLEEIIRGNPFVQRNFTEVYGSNLCGDKKDSTLKYIRNAITFTGKTRYLFEINKGIAKEKSFSNPLLVNEEVAKNDRRIPFKNMIYIGDGYTDIPCFSLLRDNDGRSFGVFHNFETASEKIKYFRQVLKPERVLSSGLPKYGKNETLGELIPLTINGMCTLILADKEREK